MSAVVLDSELVSDSPAPGDAELVERFVVARDHQAFAELVHRHGPVVLGVCRRVLHDTHDIEDVFQATFLVLVRDAAKVRKRMSLASWLYGVAYRLSLRAARQRQRRREAILVEETLVDDATFQRLTDRHDQQAVDAELNALPENYRQPLVLRYLFGKSPVEISSELGITIGAVDGLLKRGKNELRTRLLKRGITVGAALAAVQFAQETVNAASGSALIEATIEAGLAWDLGSNTMPSDLVSDRAVELAGKEGIAMTAAAKTTVTIGLTLGAIVGGFGASAMFTGQPGGRVEASGIVTTLPAMRAAQEGAAMAIVAADPIDKDENDGLKLFSGGTGSSGGSASGNVPLDAKGGAEIGSATNDAAKKGTPPNDAKSQWDFKSTSPQRKRISQELLATTEVNFTDIPLKDALDYLKELHHIQILLDHKGLSEQGISPDNTVNLTVSGVSLRSTLRALLDPLSLDYLLGDEMLEITTRDRTDSTFETRVYNNKRLPNITPTELVEIITTSIEPHRWITKAAQGTAPAAAAPQTTSAPPALGGIPPRGSAIATGNTLVIRQTQRIHDEIVELLNQLELQSIESPDSPLAPARRESGGNGAGRKGALQEDVRRSGSGSSAAVPQGRE